MGTPAIRSGPDGSLDKTDFAAIIRQLHQDLSPWPDLPDRTGSAQRRDIAAAHERLYRRALGGSTLPVGSRGRDATPPHT